MTVLENAIDIAKKNKISTIGERKIRHRDKICYIITKMLTEDGILRALVKEALIEGGGICMRLL